MTTRNLLTALAAALDGNPRPGKLPGANLVVAQAFPTPPDADTLLNALRNSATGRDQIMQRRIGLPADKPPS